MESDGSEFDYDITSLPSLVPRKKARTIPVIESSDSESTDVSEEGSVEQMDVPQSFESQAPSVEIPPEKTIIHKGREHVVIPNTGPSYIFHKSHRSKPSNI